VRTNDSAAAHVARARALAAAHEFVDAEVELDLAARLGAEAPAVARERGALFLATGREDEAAALLSVAEESPPPDLVMRAEVVARLGDATGADRLFETARDLYHDVSPFAVAWMDFERARSFEQEGDASRARSYLREAVTVLPCFAHAATHLAALEPPEAASRVLDPLAATSDDPDVVAAQADVLRRRGQDREARATAGRAAARYEEVLARLPRAYADHAARFYLGMGGDVVRALDLARANAQNRPTDEAIDLWLTAAQAAGSRDAMCAAAVRVLGRRHAPASLRVRAQAAARGCP
jgi:tetratricopeptide (TPR) repeat protein